MSSIGSLVRRRWPLLALAVVLAFIAALVANIHDAPGRGLAGEADVTASSTAPGTSARDTVTSGDVDEPGAGWTSNGEKAGAWIQLSWNEVHVLRQVVIVRPLAQPGVTGGYLGFGDGSYLQVRLSTTSPVTVVPVSPRSVATLRFTASAVDVGAKDVSVAEIVVGTEPVGADVVSGEGDAARTAVATSSTGAGGAAGWTAADPVGAWVQLAWSRPRELTSVELTGGTSTASVRSATIEFSDGTRMPVGAVPGDPARPTVVAFMPRLTTSVRVTVDSANGVGPVTLVKLGTYERGTTPARSPAAAPSATVSPDVAPCTAPTATAALAVRCPATGSVVDGNVAFQVSTAPGYSSVTATVWPGDAAAPVGAPVRAVPDASGTAQLTVDVGGLPPGPFHVDFVAGGAGRADTNVAFQLYRRATGPVSDLPSSPFAAGRTLAYAEEFDKPVSLSRTGAGADYASAKPTHDGAEDFGEAPFAGAATTQVVDNRYLRLDVEPGPSGTPHVGGLLASARQGGSGFSAQYGYFEARMFAPAAPGTWPAFWMLPSDNLVTPQPAVAEIDAVELYGHEPTGACHSTHDYRDGKDGGVARCGQRFDTERDALAWHTYGVSITPADITFTIDGRVVATSPQVAGGGSPMFFLVDLALGGGWPVDLQGVQDRASLYVDYVRVYV